jgi:hypothetical protein
MLKFPALTGVHVNVYGAVVLVPSKVDPPDKNSTFAIVPSLSVAVAAKVMVAGAA